MNNLFFFLQNFLSINFLIYYFYIKNNYFNLNNGDWGLGIGDWGLGIGDWGQSPIPHPQTPIPTLLNNFNKKFK